MFTQPQLYNAIKKHPDPSKIYLGQLVSEGIMSDAEAKKMSDEYNAYLEEEFEQSKTRDKALVYDFLSDDWEGFRFGSDEDFKQSPDTSVERKRLYDLGMKLSTLPEGKKILP